MNKLLLLSAFSVFSLAVSAQSETNKKSSPVTTQKMQSPVAVHAASATQAMAPAQAVVASPATAMAVALDVTTDGLELKEPEHNFGKIPQGKPVMYDFVITNASKTPFKLDNVQASCGCTTPEWNKEELIQPGKTGTIKVGYNAAAPGPFNKTITVTYNGNQTKQLFIKGEVWTTPAESAPENAPIKSLN